MFHKQAEEISLAQRKPKVTFPLENKRYFTSIDWLKLTWDSKSSLSAGRLFTIGQRIKAVILSYQFVDASVKQSLQQQPVSFPSLPLF